MAELEEHQQYTAESEPKPYHPFAPLTIEGEITGSETLLEMTNLQLEVLSFVDAWVREKGAPLRLPAVDPAHSPEFGVLEHDLQELLYLRDSASALVTLEQALRTPHNPEKVNAEVLQSSINKIFETEDAWTVEEADDKFVIHKSVRMKDGAVQDFTLTPEYVFRQASSKMKRRLEESAKSIGIADYSAAGHTGLVLRNNDDVALMELKFPIVMHDIYSPLLTIQSAIPLLEELPKEIGELCNDKLETVLQRVEDAEEIWAAPLTREHFEVTELQPRMEASLRLLGDKYVVTSHGELPPGSVELSTPLFDSLFTNIRQNVEKAYAKRDEIWQQVHQGEPLPPYAVAMTCELNQNRLHIYIDDNGPGFPEEMVHRGKFVKGDQTGWGSDKIATSGYGMGSLSELFKVYNASLAPTNRVDETTGEVLGARLLITIPFTPASEGINAENALPDEETPPSNS